MLKNEERIAEVKRRIAKKEQQQRMRRRIPQARQVPRADQGRGERPARRSRQGPHLQNPP